MIGQSKMQTVGVSISSNYRVDLNPGAIIVDSTNGSATSPFVFSTVQDGIGPFTYLWEVNNPSIGANGPTNADTTFGSGGFNESISGNATLTVTDTGNGNAETSKSISVRFEFEP